MSALGRPRGADAPPAQQQTFASQSRSASTEKLPNLNKNSQLGASGTADTPAVFVHLEHCFSLDIDIIKFTI